MRDSYKTPARVFASGMGQAVAERTILRKNAVSVEQYKKRIEIPRRDDISLDHEIEEYAKSNGLVIEGYDVEEGDGLSLIVHLNVVAEVKTETWADVAKRVALGNVMLSPEGAYDVVSEFHAFHSHLRQASTLMSGRHLQHGDTEQPKRNMEVFTNCATAPTNFLSFYLLLNGSGIGRAYDDDMIVVDWSNMPIICTVIDSSHKDCLSGEIQMMSRRDAEHLYKDRQKVIFDVPDSREGWTKALEMIEIMSFNKEGDKVLILDFSKVRPKGSPIRGMQNRPSSGPGPLMMAINNIARLRVAQMAPWRAAMYADHYVAECVLVGGARRAARMATKTWRDKSVLDFIEIKRGHFLWSANNSVTVDEEFWKLVSEPYGVQSGATLAELELQQHAKLVFDKVCEAAYFDGTGEPGFINVDRLTVNNEGLEELLDGNFAESHKYKLNAETLKLTQKLVEVFKTKKYPMITNPCGEITLTMLGGYCVIADVVPYHAVDDDDAEDAFRVTTRALMRTNLMDSLYKKEVRRTNRIGVGMTWLHEYAWKRFGYGWKKLVKESESIDFWQMLSRFKRAVKSEAREYAEKLGVNVPHTDTTMKPAGTTSKLFGLTEGGHLPSMREFLRWVQFRTDDPLVAEYRARNYPVRRLATYSGTTIVGFPTKPEICNIMPSEEIVVASEATPEEQYEWLRLLEKYWIRGVEEDGVTPLDESGNQISFTLKYDPKVVSFSEFKQVLLENQKTVRCCSVMPKADTSGYEYLPESAVTKYEFEAITTAIAQAGVQAVKEDVGLEHVDCASGACPISFNENRLAA